MIQKWSKKNVCVIPYCPSDKDHTDVISILKNIIRYSPSEREPSSVFLGSIYNVDDLPNDDQLAQYSADEIRERLNGAISSIIPPGTEPSDEQYSKIEAVYKEFFHSLNKAWSVLPRSKGDILYNHKLIESVGQGAFGQVYRATNLSNNADAAVKVLHPEIKLNFEYMRSFRRGVESMRILTKRAVRGMVRILDAYEIPACIFMEYIDGPNLEQAVDNNLLSHLQDSLKTLIEIGKIVNNAHMLDEVVLHRDLKPANVILKDYYTTNEIDVVVLDFDLSYHRGASLLSVVQGARAQGYAAPEQTALGRNMGVSARHTAVDVFGYGMLAFYVLIGEDPNPNEYKFQGYRDKIRNAIKYRYNPDWFCIPEYLSEIIQKCTYEQQSKRIGFQSAINAFETCYLLEKNQFVENHNPLLLYELALRLGEPENIEASEPQHRRSLIIRSQDNTKTTTLTLVNDTYGNIFISIALSKARFVSSVRNIETISKDRIIALFRKSDIFTVCSAQVGNRRLDVVVELRFRKKVSLLDIIAATDMIARAKSYLD